MATPKARAMAQAKCPHCRQGKMFVSAPYTLSGNKMNPTCPHCGFKFEIEPGYFYAAMYVSYALNVAYSVSLAMATYVLTANTDSPWLYISVILGGCFVLSPITYRYSRVILLYWLSPKVKYQPHLDTDVAVKHL